MVERALNDKLIEDGRKLVEQLDKSKAKLDSAFWLYVPDSESWRLVLDFQDIEKRGPKDAYRVVQQALGTVSPGSLTLDDVAVAKPDFPILKLLRIVIKTGPGIGSIRFTSNVINGHLIEDAYIYRLN